MTLWYQPTINYQPLKGANFTKFGQMLTLKHEIIPPKFYYLLIEAELRGDPAMYLNNFYKHINMYPNVVTRI